MKEIITVFTKDGKEEKDTTTLLEELANEFFLSKEDIKYIISKTPKNSSQGIQLFASLLLFSRCQRSKIPSISHKLFIKKIGRKGYIIQQKDLSLAIKKIRKQRLYPSFCPVSILDLFETYKPFIRKELKVEEGGLEKTELILVKAEEKQILSGGKSPVSAIFSALYIALILTGNRRTQAEIANISGVSMPAIQQNYKHLAEELDIEILL